MLVGQVILANEYQGHGLEFIGVDALLAVHMAESTFGVSGSLGIFNVAYRMLC